MMLKTTRPRLDFDAARSILKGVYGVEARELEELASERDQNFLAETSSGKLVLKIANLGEERAILEFQNEALTHIAQKDPELSIPRIRAALSGCLIETIEGGYMCRLLNFRPGTPLAETRPHREALLRDIGRFMGRLDRALEAFSHDAQDRYLYWDSKHAATTIREGLECIAGDERRGLVEHYLSSFEDAVAPILKTLPKGVIHNDGNDHNILVRDSTMAGILDFGDIVSSALVFEVANTATYCILDKKDPIRIASHVVAGYHEAHPLSATELELVFPLICTRLTMSVANAARQAKDEPDQDYLRVSERAAWQMLEKLKSICPRLAHYRFRDACGLSPLPHTQAVVDWLGAHAEQAVHVLPEALLDGGFHELDLSVSSTELGGLDVLDDVERFTAHVFGTMRDAGARVGIGRYDEPRALYTSEAFRPGPGEGFEPRTIHIGIDLFVEAGTSLRAPFAGRVHSFQVNDAPLDYGPTIILEHETDEGEKFWTLYGHLSEDSLFRLEHGKSIDRGEAFAAVGSYPKNGNWPPHLHFQIILDLLDSKGDFPGVAKPSERTLWLALSPNPRRVLGLAEPAPPDPRMTDEAIRSTRRQHLSGTLSLSYREPLRIVRGHGAFLYDSEARPYLDMVNNVCHVGHCHPRVVRAAQNQMAVLNTNTRYLHPNIVNYAERLTAKLPAPLEVCFFVNSGSEANDLALRLARTHSGRKDALVLDGAYHGNLTSLIEVSPYKFDGRGGRGAPPHVHKLAMPDGYRGQYRASDPEYRERYLRDAQTLIERLARDGRPVGSLIAESILSCGGQIVLPPDYLKGLYALVREAGGVSIADEVQVGFGRVGSHFWAFETQDALPDIVTMGKPIGNGHPLAAVVTTRAIAESFQTGMEYFNTFGGNPVSCAIGLSVLDVIEEEKLQANAHVVGEHLLNGLRELQGEHPIIGDVRGRGLFLGLELVRHRETLEPAAEEATYLVNRMKDSGVLNSTDGPLENVIKLKPPLVFTKANANEFLDRLRDVLREDFLKR